jgi:transposase
LDWPLPDALPDAELNRRLYADVAGAEHPPVSERPLPDWSRVHAELRRKGVTKRLLWLEYREAHPDGYGYSRFCALYAVWAGHLHPTMRLVHKAGERCFVDYAGQTIEVIDPETGEIHDAQLFLAALGASSYFYAEAQWSQELPHWIEGHVHAFGWFGGVTELVVPDNLKSGVKRPCRYEPDINPTYQDFARHYGIAVVPARVKKARDKAKVEVAVQVAERWILARLRDQQFVGLAALNAAIRTLLDALNDRPMRHLGKSRRELFETIDRPALRPLPEAPYEFATFKKATVGIDYHVAFDGNFYSVPFHLTRRRVEVRATARTVEVCHQFQRVASHRRGMAGAHHYYTLDEHRPPNHKQYGQWSPERFLAWAEKIGPATREVIQTRLHAKVHPEQAYRSCLGILGLAKRTTDSRLEAACARAVRCGISHYRGIKNILDSRFDQLSLDLTEPATPSQPAHPNVRGPGYYH